MYDKLVKRIRYAKMNNPLFSKTTYHSFSLRPCHVEEKKLMNDLCYFKLCFGT